MSVSPCPSCHVDFAVEATAAKGVKKRVLAIADEFDMPLGDDERELKSLWCRNCSIDFDPPADI